MESGRFRQIPTAPQASMDRPAATDVRHRVSPGGTINSKWNIAFSPLPNVTSGPPFDITVGRDIYETTPVQWTARHCPRLGKTRTDRDIVRSARSESDRGWKDSESKRRAWAGHHVDEFAGNQDGNCGAF